MFIHKIITSIFLLSILTSCASTKEKERHSSFLKQVQLKRETLNKGQYKHYLRQAIDRKEGELLALEQQMDENNKRMDHHEVMQSNSTQLDPHSFNKTTTGMALKNIDNRIKNVKKELFLLKSQLSL